MMSTFQTEDYHGYNVKFSPFAESRFACATSQNYGLRGKGAVYVLDLFPGDNIIKAHSILRWPQDGVFDVCWSEINDQILWSVSGDGHIQIWNVADANNYLLAPVQVIKAHNKEIYNIEWNQVRGENSSVLTASWDTTVKQWDGFTGQCIQTFTGADSIVYSISWNPRVASTFASVSADGFMRIYNTREVPDKPCFAFRVNDGESLSCDWCKYHENVIAAAGTDGLIGVWDTRLLNKGPVTVLSGHHRAVKKVKFSPHYDSMLASVSYDFTTKIWDFKLGLNPSSNPLLMTFQNHREFVYGLDFNMHLKDQIADCGWDRIIKVFSITPFAYVS
ncbi:peroxisomal targeting signal 2 receptor-like protein [Leptotrombidium deliense]|uniref:Peroxin-7 n=1 Tax=Leptotrombidium deliense TaxID=299467 RepID=A0A443SGZ2_9ACAR|nr:peroxisomal targeting signal 2 receptor-like protein [Leptotrombidium deliense]